MKKLFCAILLSMFVMPCMANICVPGQVASKVIQKYVPVTHMVSALTEYNKYLKDRFKWGTMASNACLSAKNLWNVCVAAGWDIKQPGGKESCLVFVKELVRSSYSLYYEVCGSEKGKSDGREYCVEIFDDVQVQLAQAQNLAQEYAKVRFNDDIRCSNTIRQSSNNDDYIKCTSYDKKTYYEFRFDDAKESNALQNVFIREEFSDGLCRIYNGWVGGEDESKLTAVREGYTQSVTDCNIMLAPTQYVKNCTELNNKVKKFGYTAEKWCDRLSKIKLGGKQLFPQSESCDNTKCVITYGGENIQRNDDYYAKFDGKTLSVFYKKGLIKSWPAVSGRGKTSQDSRPTICQTPKYQACKEVGPVPSGTYYISQNEIQYADNIEVGDFEHNSPKYTRRNLPENRTGWGDARVLLVPDSSTNTYGRTGMYIHGGKFRGSAGCIDLTINVADFMSWFGQQTDFVSLKVVVDYGVVKDICGVKCSTAPCDCTCPKEINSETHETTCTYL